MDMMGGWRDPIAQGAGQRLRTLDRFDGDPNIPAVDVGGDARAGASQARCRAPLALNSSAEMCHQSYPLIPV